MDRLIPKGRKSSIFCREDIDRIKRVAMDHGYLVSSLHADQIWRDFSSDLCATWLILPEEDEEVWNILLDYSEAAELDPEGEEEQL